MVLILEFITDGLPKTNYGEMCIFNLLVTSSSQISTTKNAFLKGNCDSTQVSLIDGEASSTTLLSAIPDLDTAAADGSITSGDYPYRSDKYTIRMVLLYDSTIIIHRKCCMGYLRATQGGETFNNAYN